MSQFFGNSFLFCKGDHQMKVVRDGECWGTEPSSASCVFIHHKTQSCGEPSPTRSPCLGAAGVFLLVQIPPNTRFTLLTEEMRVWSRSSHPDAGGSQRIALSGEWQQHLCVNDSFPPVWSGKSRSSSRLLSLPGDGWAGAAAWEEENEAALCVDIDFC